MKCELSLDSTFESNIFFKFVRYYLIQEHLCLSLKSSQFLLRYRLYLAILILNYSNFLQQSDLWPLR